MIIPGEVEGRFGILRLRDGSAFANPLLRSG